MKPNPVMNRAARRRYAFKKRIPSMRVVGYGRPSGIMQPGVQDSSKTVYKMVHTPYIKKSHTGVSYTHYKIHCVMK